MTRRVLIIDDEEAVCWALARAFQAEGYATEVAATAERGLQLAAERPPQVVFLDVRLPGMNGITALGQLRTRIPNLPVVVMTAYGDLPTAVQAVQGGACDYLIKPFDLTQALRAANMAWPAPSAPRGEARVEFADDELIGQSVAMQQVYKQIAMVAGSATCVLITGESGTGKGLVARALHRHSACAAGPFLPVHAAALNQGLVESELFGHVRGAFTGAAETRTGLLALAAGGTVFLDEVAEIPLPVQVKLLRALELGEVLPVGGDKPVRHDFRILAATNRDLPRLVDEGHFRQDLFFRLKVFCIHMPPLRERPEDIPELAKHFLRRFAPGGGSIAESTLEYLAEQSWPGNVRELRNSIERAALLARGGLIMPDHVNDPVHAPAHDGTGLAASVRQWLRTRLNNEEPIANLSSELLQAIEPTLLEEVMRRTQGNKSTAAEWLGLDRATVRKKLQLYGLEDEGANAN